MDREFEISASTKFNAEILKQLERPCQIFGVQMVLTRENEVTLIKTVDNQFTTLEFADKFGQTDMATKALLTPRHFKSRQNFYVTINDEVMSNKVALLAFKLDENGFIEVTSDDKEFVVVMHAIPREMAEKIYTKDITASHGGILNPFSGQSFVTGVEFLPDKKGLIISFRKPSNRIYGNGKSVPDEVWQEKHEIIDGVLVHTSSRLGVHHPQSVIDEHTTWDNGWDKLI